jgi:hypothetical protein
MTDFKTSIETIFLEAVKVLGKAEAMKLLATIPEPKQETKAETKKEVKAETTKRISRMTPTLANQLRAELVKGGVVFTENEKKEFEKLKKEFVVYVDGLTNENFIAKNLTQHMVEFANSKKAVPAEEKSKAKPKSQKKPKEKEIPPPPNSNAAIEVLDLDDLQQIEMIITPYETQPGVYFNGDSGKWVTGPAEEEEDGVDKEFKGKMYSIGEKTGRVYEVVDDEHQKFAGFIGVGSFVGLKLN